jgi:hypothetical protein
MWFSPPEYSKEVTNYNEVFRALEGELDETEGRVTFIDFLRCNLGFAVELLTGIKLAPYQEITLRGLMNRQYSMCVWGRGCGKTFIASIFCMMQAMLENNSRMIVVGPTFRTSRFIFNKIEEILEGKNCRLARQAFGMHKDKRNDLHQFILPNKSAIAAIPLNGEKIRGFRANILVIDEYLLMSREIIDTVLMPFLTAPQDMDARQAIIEKEDELISKGLMSESERGSFENKTKVIALSSASYTFENLYTTYCDWLRKIYHAKESFAEYSDGDEKPPKYFICQLAWNAIPKHMINQSIIKEAEQGGTSNAIFRREYCAQFDDGSEGFFSAKKMQSVTVQDGQAPTIQLTGNKNSKYILSIDPSFSQSPTSDDFAMSLIEIEEESQTGTLVHAYGEHGKELKEHIKYFYYLISNFNIVFIAIDNAGHQFIDACNESRWLRDKNIEIKFMDFDPSKKEPDRVEEMILAKSQYNLQHNRKAVRIVFSNNDWIRNSNEWLQGCIEYKKIWFASKAQARESAFNTMVNTKLDRDLLSGTLLDKAEAKEEFQMDRFIEKVGHMIALTCKQCAMIDPSTNARGTQTFDLPTHLAKEKGPDRARRDNYTSLLIGIWAMKTYFEMANAKEEVLEESFCAMV